MGTPGPIRRLGLRRGLSCLLPLLALTLVLSAACGSSTPSEPDGGSAQPPDYGQNADACPNAIIPGTGDCGPAPPWDGYCGDAYFCVSGTWVLCTEGGPWWCPGPDPCLSLGGAASFGGCTRGFTAIDIPGATAVPSSHGGGMCCVPSTLDGGENAAPDGSIDGFTLDGVWDGADDESFAEAALDATDGSVSQ